MLELVNALIPFDLADRLRAEAEERGMTAAELAGLFIAGFMRERDANAPAQSLSDADAMRDI